MPENAEDRQLLVELLHRAAHLEHCLLNTYLYAACTLKSTPQEFATVDGAPNRRRAIQYEATRAWKERILRVAHEEMLHLHYVQCLLRGLGEAPMFGLPPRDEQRGHWLIGDWKAPAGRADDHAAGVAIPLEPLSRKTILRFMVYESADSFRSADPFGPGPSALFDRLHAIERELALEGVLLHVEDGKRDAIKSRLHAIYETLPPVAAAGPGTAPAPPTLAAEDFKFASIADLYGKGILPLYEKAFDFGWATHSNIDLNHELLDPAYAMEGFLPIGPNYRGKDFAEFSRQNATNPLRNYKHVQDIIREIVEEGEGESHFAEQAALFLAKVEELGGARAYLKALRGEIDSADPTPEWLAQCEALRQSHLYRFATVMTELKHEQALAQSVGAEFNPARAPIAIDPAPELAMLADGLPAQFNACYLVLLCWLGRIYEIADWDSDRPRRMSIEQMATWPLMSLAIRPLLELTSFFPIQPQQLFCLTPELLPDTPIHARQLHRLANDPARSQAIKQQMDDLIVRVLADVAAWADDQKRLMATVDLPPHDKTMILSRLSMLAQLQEFDKQFTFRVSGGYSDKLPDAQYQAANPDGAMFGEDPTAPAALYEETLAIRLRFAGWGTVQLATDFDPPSDEAGCTGTHKLHAADGDRRFDRALFWQNSNPERIILREPRGDLPPVGVNCTDIALVVAEGRAAAGYRPLPTLASFGARPVFRVEQELAVEGFLDLLALSPQECLGDGRTLRMDLLPKDGAPPLLMGNNHLVWRDGEPIDPFVLAVLADSAGAAPAPQLLFQREIYNQGRSLLQMEPLQRALAARGPCGFDSVQRIPAWVRARMPAAILAALDAPDFPRSYLVQRAGVLGAALAAALAGDPAGYGQPEVDAIASLAERLRGISTPDQYTVAWLNYVCHYGHTVSGDLRVGDEPNPIFAAIAARTGLDLEATILDDRDAPNARWLVKYGQGLMDTDALSDLVFGELYVPVAPARAGQPLAFARQWAFPAGMRQAIADYACRFDRPFWGAYAVAGQERSRAIQGFSADTVLSETLLEQRADGYRYALAGLAGVMECAAAFDLDDGADQTVLRWSVSFSGDHPAVVVRMLRAIAQTAQAISGALRGHFGPRE